MTHSLRLGIGIVTYNRRHLLSDTIARVRDLTRWPNTVLAIADDGSTDGTMQMLRERGLPVVTGANMGVCWNKNRALFLLNQLLNCDVVLLLEDDSQPNRAGWEAEWIEAVRLYGHINYAGPWLRDHFISGSGTAADPIRASAVTAQCAGYGRACLTYGGYFDSRFHGYGHGHVEHTRRLVRTGYGGMVNDAENGNAVEFWLLLGDIVATDAPSFYSEAQADRNWQVAADLMGDETYRAPWRNRAEMSQFRSEMEGAMRRHPRGYALHTRSRVLGPS